MQQYVVPQFITVEDKILGPITVRQFLILLILGLLEFFIFKLADLTLFILLSLPILTIALVLAFVKINGKPFHFFLLNFIATVKKTRVRIWSPGYTQIYNLNYAEKKEKKKIQEADTYDIDKVTELSKTVDTAGKYTR